MYQILGKYKSKQEEFIDKAETKEEIEYLLKEYRMAFGSDWHLRIKKIKEEA